MLLDHELFLFNFVSCFVVGLKLLSCVHGMEAQTQSGGLLGITQVSRRAQHSFKCLSKLNFNVDKPN